MSATAIAPENQAANSHAEIVARLVGEPLAPLTVRQIDEAAAGNCHDEFAAQHGNFAPIRQLNRERLKWLGLIERFGLFERH